MANCVRCVYAEWERTVNGRLHPSGEGKCTWKYEAPKLPASMNYIHTAGVCGGHINRKDGLAKPCPCFTERT